MRDDPQGASDHVRRSRDQAQAALQRAMAAHAAGDIDGALGAAASAIAADPQYADAHAYVGNTLVTRKRRFADGLAALEHAVTLSPHDAALWYTLGWCREYVANALARPKGGRAMAQQPVAQDAGTLYTLAREALFEALRQHPEPGLRGDIVDILDVIGSHTGVWWDPAEFPED